MTILSLKNLNKRYGALVVTDGVSLDVAKGEIVGILGPNGAGKTTLFNLIAGTVQPDSGQVFFNNQDVSNQTAAQRCKMGVSRSFQVPHPFTGMTVFENILVGAAFGRNNADPEAHALKTMEITGMKPKANHLAGSITLLERKRLEMARALATEPELLLLDEIAGGLTERECQSLLAAIKDVHSSGVTIVWIEHVVHALLSVAQRLVVLNFGKLIADGKPEDVMRSKDVKSVYLGEDAHA
ncbi:MAG: ABC transporter ATP-binding protein [Alphaproteobacteria bacterium]|nr:ABC transporter ATP-binding protein [Alphaproteobacteria bacterium]